MQQALALAAQGMCLTSPNPRVGCVITNTQGQVIGQGHTQQAGGPHAEIMALEDAKAQGHSAQGATAYVTLEPCAHHGRTGPCCEALVQAGIARVVAAIQDPNPQVAGQGFARLRAAGIEVQVGQSSQAARELNLGFFSRFQRKKPWVRMKIAASLDGQTALQNGQSQWITGQEARTDGHAWRARACAILTGIGTVLEDDPMRDVRLTPTVRQPHLVVIDSRLETPLNARLFHAGTPSGAQQRQIWIYAALDQPEKRAALQALGAQVILAPNPHGKVDLAAMMADLATRQINELHVEAGHKLNGSLIREGWVDEFLVYLAPKMLGAGQGMAQWGPLTELSQALALNFVASDMIGPDLRILARVSQQDAF